MLFPICKNLSVVSDHRKQLGFKPRDGDSTTVCPTLPGVPAHAEATLWIPRVTKIDGCPILSRISRARRKLECLLVVFLSSDI